MSTEAQKSASRQNGALSSGPVSAEGKARSAQNATRHGLTGGPVVLPNESQEEYDAFLQSYVKAWRPRTLAELDIIHQMAAGRWRLRRIEHMEAAILNQAFERQMEAMGADDADADLAIERAYADVAENSKGWRNLDRHQRTLERSYQQSVKAYLELQEQSDHELLTPSHPPTPPQTPKKQNEPEPDYSCLKSLYADHPKAAAFMPKMLGELRRMNSAPPEVRRSRA